MANFENVLTVCRKCSHSSEKENSVSVSENFAVFKVSQIFFWSAFFVFFCSWQVVRLCLDLRRIFIPEISMPTGFRGSWVLSMMTPTSPKLKPEKFWTY